MSKTYPVRNRDRRPLRFSAQAITRLAVLAVAGSLLLWLATVFAGPSEAQSAVMSAWQQVRAAGAYQFAADIEQETIPLPTAGNVGRSSKTQRIYVEGTTDLNAKTLQMALWSGGGSVLDPSAAAQVKVENDKTYARLGDGTWQEAENFTGGFAPQGDFLTFLHAAKNIQAAGDAGDAGLTRYTFDLDGPQYARYVRDTMQAQVVRAGALPHGVVLALPAQYVDMTGRGELWLSASGRPVRQQIELELPAAANADYRSRADIAVTFVYPDQPDTLQAANPAPLGIDFQPGALRGLIATVLAGLPQAAGTFFVLLVVLGLTLLLVRRTHSRKLYVAISLSVILVVLATPLLQAAEWQRFDAYVQSQAPAEDPAAREVDETMAAYQADQQTSSLRTAQRLALLQGDSGIDQDADGVSDARELALGSNPLVPDSAASVALNPLAAAPDDGTDSDGDGLSDVQEGLIGTKPFSPDSDGDVLTDSQEVVGFLQGSQRWYSDPQKTSTLDDNVLDGQKCPNFPACPDSDADGTPDMADRDIDNDGVPNVIDLSPFKVGSPSFTGGAPLALTINGLSANAPTYVEFQLRPTNQARLWYAFNVLDWPSGDAKGQVQRADRGADDPQTYFDVCAQQAIANGQDPNAVCSMTPDDNGDIKLIPMLEIQAGGFNNNLPSDQELDQFGGIAVRSLGAYYGAPKVVYVPLNIVTEPNAGDRVAFYGKMLYKPGSNWGTAQQVRLVWVVQMLLDECADYDGGVCISYDAYNSIQPVQTYYDEWKLTGLNIREDRGTNFAIIYEDPTAPNLPPAESVLTPLSVDLDGAFLSARDCDTDIDGTCYGDGQPDLTVNGRGVNAPTIAGRLDRFQNSGVPDVQRWGLPNVLRVINKSYGHRDEAFGRLSTTDTQDLLDSVFTPLWSTANPISPSLLFAREERFRALNLAMTPRRQRRSRADHRRPQPEQVSLRRRGRPLGDPAHRGCLGSLGRRLRRRRARRRRQRRGRQTGHSPALLPVPQPRLGAARAVWRHVGQRPQPGDQRR